MLLPFLAVGLLFSMANIHAMINTLVSIGLGWPSWVFLIFVMAIVIGIGALLHRPLMRLNDRLSAQQSSGDHSEMAGHFLGAIGVIYAVLLAFVVVMAWQQFDHAEEISMQEQRDVVGLFDIVGAYKQNHRRDSVAIQSLLRRYALNMLGEGRQMLRGEPLCLDTGFGRETDPACQLDDSKWPYGTLPASRLNNDLVPVIRDKVMNLPRSTLADESVYKQSVVLLEDFVDLRDHRRHHYSEPMLSILWITLFIGGLIIVCLPYLGQGQRNSLRQSLRTLALCTMIGLIIGLTLVFDHPFTGGVATQGVKQWCTIWERFDLDLGVVRSPGCPFQPLNGR